MKILKQVLQAKSKWPHTVIQLHMKKQRAVVKIIMQLERIHNVYFFLTDFFNCIKQFYVFLPPLLNILDSAWCTMDGGSWHCTGDRDQDNPQEKEMQKSKIAVWGGLTNSCEIREVKSKGEKERYTHLNAEFQRIARRDKKAFLSDQCKETEENNRMGKTRDLFKKIRDTKGTFLHRWAR